MFSILSGSARCLTTIDHQPTTGDIRLTTNDQRRDGAYFRAMAWSRRLQWVPIGAAVAALAAAGASSPGGAPDPAAHTHLVIVVDGLRPDYVTPDLMPRLVRLGRRGIVFNAHHSVFPTVTRVNASSIATGAYPETHGLLGNTVFIPSVDAARGLDTGDRENLERVARAEGRLLTAPTLGELLQRSGMKVLGVSSGSTGSAFLLNHTVSSGAIIHTDYTLPASLGPGVAAALGPVPPHPTPNDT